MNMKIYNKIKCVWLMRCIVNKNIVEISFWFHSNPTNTSYTSDLFKPCWQQKNNPFQVISCLSFLMVYVEWESGRQAVIQSHSLFHVSFLASHVIWRCFLCCYCYYRDDIMEFFKHLLFFVVSGLALLEYVFERFFQSDWHIVANEMVINSYYLSRAFRFWKFNNLKKFIKVGGIVQLRKFASPGKYFMR